MSLTSGTSPFAPYTFLAKLGSSISRTRKKKFQVIRDQDAGEVLGHIFGEILGAACLSGSKLTTHISSQTFCRVCNSGHDTEDTLFVLSVDLSSSVQTSIDALTKEDSVSDRFCNYCQTLTEAVIKRKFVALPSNLAVQLKRFQSTNGTARKRIDRVRCNRVVSLSVQQDSITIQKSFKLVSVVNHSGSTSNGHYTTTVINGRNMYLCNDRNVTTCQQVDYKTAYILIYEQFD